MRIIDFISSTVNCGDNESFINIYLEQMDFTKKSDLLQRRFHYSMFYENEELNSVHRMRNQNSSKFIVALNSSSQINSDKTDLHTIS